MVSKQEELEGMRPKRLATIEAAVHDLVDAKEAHKKTKETVDQAADEVASALKAAGETTYGFKDGKTMIIVSLEDKEAVRLSVKEPKARKGSGRS